MSLHSTIQAKGLRAESRCLHEVSVASNEEIAPGIYLLAFLRGIDFVPGQALALTTDPAIPARYYSIASGRNDPMIEVLYDLVPDGLLTPRLAALRQADVFLASEAFGAFCDGPGRSVWIAAGTGVAPFASMARSGMLEGKTLVHGGRTLAGLFMRGYFSSVLNGRYVPCCSTEVDVGVYHGRSTAWLADAELPDVERYLVCGSSRMVVDARDALIARGVSFNRVVAEIYF